MCLMRLDCVSDEAYHVQSTNSLKEAEGLSLLSVLLLVWALSKGNGFDHYKAVSCVTSQV